MFCPVARFVTAGPCIRRACSETFCGSLSSAHAGGVWCRCDPRGNPLRVSPSSSEPLPVSRLCPHPQTAASRSGRDPWCLPCPVSTSQSDARLCSRSTLIFSSFSARVASELWRPVAWVWLVLRWTVLLSPSSCAVPSFGPFPVFILGSADVPEVPSKSSRFVPSRPWPLLTRAREKGVSGAAGGRGGSLGTSVFSTYFCAAEQVPPHRLAQGSGCALAAALPADVPPMSLPVSLWVSPARVPRRDRGRRRLGLPARCRRQRAPPPRERAGREAAAAAPFCGRRKWRLRAGGAAGAVAARPWGSPCHPPVSRWTQAAPPRCGEQPPVPGSAGGASGAPRRRAAVRCWWAEGEAWGRGEGTALGKGLKSACRGLRGGRKQLLQRPEKMPCAERRRACPGWGDELPDRSRFMGSLVYFKVSNQGHAFQTVPAKIHTRANSPRCRPAFPAADGPPLHYLHGSVRGSCRINKCCRTVKWALQAPGRTGRGDEEFLLLPLRSQKAPSLGCGVMPKVARFPGPTQLWLLFEGQ